MSGIILPSWYGATHKIIAAGDPSDPYFNAVTLRLNFDGADESQIFSDSSVSPLAITQSNVFIDSAQARTGETSGRFYTANTLSYLRFAGDLPEPLNILAGDFTIEFSVYLTDTSRFAILGNLDSSSGNGDYWIILNGAQNVQFCTKGTGSLQTANFGTNNLATNTWLDCKLIRTGGVISCYVNGTQIGSTVAGWADRVAANTTQLRIGATSDGQFPLKGWLDDIRVTKSVARSVETTWNAATAQNATLSENNLRAEATSASLQSSCVSTVTRDASENRYFEFHCYQGTSQFACGIGVNSNGTANSASDTAYTHLLGQKRRAGSYTNYGAAWTASVTIGVHLNNGSLTFYRNGSSQGVAFTGLTGNLYASLNMAKGSGFPFEGKVNFGASEFTNPMPTGSLSWDGSQTA